MAGRQESDTRRFGLRRGRLDRNKSADKRRPVRPDSAPTPSYNTLLGAIETDNVVAWRRPFSSGL